VAKLARVLKTDIMGDLTALAELLQSKGRDGDSILAHISPKEAKMLKKAGGRGSKNPDTGLLEFADGPELPEQVVYGVQPGDYAPDLSQAQFFKQKPSGSLGLSFDPYVPASETVQAPASTRYKYQGPAAPAASIDPSLVSSIRQTGADLQSDLLKAPPRPSLYQRGVEALGGYGNLAQLGITGLLGLQGQKTARDAAKQSQQYAAQQQAMALPYQVSGQKMATAAERGELTPASRQAYDAARAQMAQAGEARGGVAVAQSATQLESFRQQLLQNQYTYGLQVANIGDNIALGAIRTGMQADQYVNQATMGFYSMLGNFSAQRFQSPEKGVA